MNEHTSPIEFLIEFAWANGADRFTVNNAKDQFKKLREDSEDSKRWYSCEKELTKLKQEYNKLLESVAPLDSNNQEFFTNGRLERIQYGKFTK